MLCREADACFWIGRYVERAEATARMVDVHYSTALEMSSPTQAEVLHWETLLAIAGSTEAYAARYTGQNDHDVLHFFAFDVENPNSILSCWERARHSARVVREQLSSEMWESLNAAYLRMREWNVEKLLADSPHVFFQMVKDASHLFQGILNRTMLMDEARDWLDAGRFLERASQTPRLLDIKYKELLGDRSPTLEVTPDIHQWIAVLKSVSAFEMYRKVHQEGIRPEGVVDFLVFDIRFPASVRHGIARVEGCLRRIGGNPQAEPCNEAELRVGRLLADLTYSRAKEIVAAGLHSFLNDVQRRCAEIGEAISMQYLAY